MKNEIRNYLRAYNDVDHIVFYIEELSDWGFLGDIYNQVSSLLENSVVLTSDKNDPHLNTFRNIFYVGRGFRRVSLFRQLKCKLLVTTLTDLHNLQLKRSFFDVKYVYIFHSLASTTAVYLRDAFRHYDYIFCAGPHQLLELRSYFDKVSQKPILVEHGYNKIDKLVKQIPRERLLQKKTILIAPSWGPSSLNESDIEILIQELIKDYRVIVRFHPMEIKKKKVFMNKIIMKFPDTNFHNDTSNLDDLINSDLLITDWSGIAIEFGLGLRKPVISINYPQKVRNKDFGELEQITFENSIRKEIGIILEREQLWNIQDHVQKLINSWQPELVRKHTESFVYNLGESVKIASDKIIEIYKSLTRV